MKDFLLKTFKDKKQVFIFVTILLVAFTTFSLLNALLTEDDVEPTEVVDLTPQIPYRSSTDDELPDPKKEQKTEERMIAPVQPGEDYTIISGYYDVNASEEERMNSLIVYNNIVQNSTTTNFKAVSSDVFDVVAVFSGTVLKVNSTLLYGSMVEIQHENGVTSTYYSLGDILVDVDQIVDQGDVIGVSGSCEIDAENGLQVRLRIQKDGTNVNPQTYLGTKISEIN
ncbi:M23 family metallopeptidase [Mycoplasmatota bacterium WC44]